MPNPSAATPALFDPLDVIEPVSRRGNHGVFEQVDSGSREENA
jgi:hypothetical protein